MLYDGWLPDVAARFQAAFDKIKVVHNFDHGPEFEIAVCEILRELLPRRVGVCRGFIVSEGCVRAGDDIILFDAQRFPTLRGLGDDLSRKEGVPAEGVLAYIEAKHTLYLDEANTSGQSFTKAAGQVAAAKTVPREETTRSRGYVLMKPGETVGVTRRTWRGETHCNPYYGAIWARYVDGDPLTLIERLRSRVAADGPFPDAIVAGQIVALPAATDDGQALIAPFLNAMTRLGVSHDVSAPFGIGMAHLLWAVEHIELGDMPWARMLAECAPNLVFAPAANEPAPAVITDPEDAARVSAK